MCVETVLVLCRKVSLVSLLITSKNENNTTALIKENCIEANFKPGSQICSDHMEGGGESFLSISLSLSMQATKINSIHAPISKENLTHTHTQSYYGCPIRKSCLFIFI